MVATSKYGVRRMRTRGAAGPGPGAVVRGFAWLARMLRRARQRARLRGDLAHIDERMLRDINARRLDLEAEARKPFWRA